MCLGKEMRSVGRAHEVVFGGEDEVVRRRRWASTTHTRRRPSLVSGALRPRCGQRRRGCPGPDLGLQVAVAAASTSRGSRRVGAWVYASATVQWRSGGGCRGPVWARSGPSGLSASSVFDGSPLQLRRGCCLAGAYLGLRSSGLHLYIAERDQWQSGSSSPPQPTCGVGLLARTKYRWFGHAGLLAPGRRSACCWPPRSGR